MGATCTSLRRWRKPAWPTTASAGAVRSPAGGRAPERPPACIALRLPASCPAAVTVPTLPQPMSNSLRDALRQAGVLEQFRTHARREGRQAGKGKGGRTGSRPAHASARPEGQTRNDPRQDEEIDLARAYALRAQAEQREREEKARAEREAAERRRRQREQIAALVEGRTLNRGDAEVVRNFEYGGKIRRVYGT